MSVVGWNKDDVKEFQDLLVKANIINLRAMKLLVDAEIEDRECDESFNLLKKRV